MQRICLLAAVLALAACDRGGKVRNDTAGGDVEVKMTHDTVNVPVFSTQKDTIIVDKPVITGRKPVDIKHPTIVKKP